MGMPTGATTQPATRCNRAADGDRHSIIGANAIIPAALNSRIDWTSFVIGACGRQLNN